MQPIEELREDLAHRQRFMMMVAHEMRNLLVPLTCGLELLASADESIAGRVRPAMSRQLSQLRRLVEDLLDIAGSEQGLMRLCVTSVDLRDVVTAAIDVARPVIEAREHRLTLLQNPPDPAVIDGDHCRLTQALSNLLINAAKFTPPCGDIYVSLQYERPCVKMCVRDTGMGIAADLLPGIFNIYARPLRAPDGTHSSLGLGLAVARHLVELHGGTLCAYSGGPGKGSEFVMRLPLAASC